MLNHILSRGSINILEKLQEHDIFTYAHSCRVAQLSKCVAEIMSGDLEFILDVYSAALLHDVGKLYVPIEILKAPRGLTLQEKCIVDMHALYGANVLVYENNNIRQAIGQHHMDYNEGSGEIANIVHVCDVFDALTSHRAYKVSYSPIQSIKIIRNGYGTQFMKEAVNALHNHVFQPKIYKTLYLQRLMNTVM